MMMAGFGVAAGGFLIGAISGGVALSKTHQLNRDCGGTVCPASKQSDIDSAKSWAGFSTVSFAVAAIGAVVGFNGYLLGNDSKPTQSSARVQVKPILGFGAAGLEGSF